MSSRRFRYVGPADLRDLPHAEDAIDVTDADVLGRWLAGRSTQDRAAPFTYVVTVDGALRVAPRQREHVACAGGEDVLGAGEIQFDIFSSGGIVVTAISNQSTGYCPDLDSWTAVAAALDRAGLHRPDQFTHPIAFRACTGCFTINIVRDDDFVCAVCGRALPVEWNLAES